MIRTRINTFQNVWPLKFVGPIRPNNLLNTPKSSPGDPLSLHVAHSKQHRPFCIGEDLSSDSPAYEHIGKNHTREHYVAIGETTALKRDISTERSNGGW